MLPVNVLSRELMLISGRTCPPAEPWLCVPFQMELALRCTTRDVSREPRGSHVQRTVIVGDLRATPGMEGRGVAVYHHAWWTDGP